jgi:hypothetical protein
MEKKINEFRDLWDKHYAFVSLELNDQQIEVFINNSKTIQLAVDNACDFLLASGNAIVQE